MNAFFEELFRYSHHSNHQLTEVFLQDPHTVSEKAHKLFSHILNAQHIWNQRIKGSAPRYAVWDLQPLAQLSILNDELLQESVELLPQSDRLIHYTNTKGESFQNSARDILFHVINHSTYHRAQIASELKTNGILPPATDFIFYKRQ